MDTCEVLLYFVIILINLLILNYIFKLEKISCECSKDWKRDYIKYFSYISIVIILIMFCFAVSGKKNLMKLMKNKFFIIFINLFSIASLVNIYSLFKYSQQMVLSLCECSKSWERTFIYYYSMIIMSVYIFIISSIIFFSLCIKTKLIK